MNDTYRVCASIAVFRPIEPGSLIHQMLLVHKPRKNDAWQLPQGGCEAGESLEEAAVRELMEEAGLEVELIGKSDQVYQYDFPASYRRFRPDHICGQRVQYVFAQADDGATVQVDGEEIDDYVWVVLEQLPKYIKRKKYLDIVHALYTEGVALLMS